MLTVILSGWLIGAGVASAFALAVKVAVELCKSE
jgi:hypothetical protein